MDTNETFIYDHAGIGYMRMVDAMNEELFDKQCDIYDKKYPQTDAPNNCTQLEFDLIN